MNDLTASLNKLLSSLRYGERIRPLRDWIALLGAVVVLLACSFLWNLWLFAQVTSGQPIGQAPAAPELGAPALDNVDALFQARANEAEQYKGVYRFVDPSI